MVVGVSCAIAATLATAARPVERFGETLLTAFCQ
jgi:hypothetical protein